MGCTVTKRKPPVPVGADGKQPESIKSNKDGKTTEASENKTALETLEDVVDRGLISPGQITKGGALDVDSVTKVDCGAADTPRKLTVHASISDLRNEETAFSEIITIGGLDWAMHVDRLRFKSTFLVVAVACDNYATKWSAHLKVTIKLTFPDGHTMEREVDVTANHDDQIEEKMLPWKKFEAALPESDKDGELVVEATFHVVDVSGLFIAPLDVLDHSVASNQYNCILKVDGRKVYVAKQVLAFHSAHFGKLFFGEEAVPTRDEYTLDDVSHEEFVRLLAHLRAPSAGLLTDETVESMLRVSTKFDFQEVIQQCEDLLFSSETMPLYNKLALADTFSLTLLEDACLNEINTRPKAMDIMADFDGFKMFSDRLKYAIARRGLLAEGPSEWCTEEEEEEGDEDGATTP